MGTFCTNESVSLERKVKISGLMEKTHPELLFKIYEIHSIQDWITTNRFKRVAFQFPDSLICDSSIIVAKVQEATDDARIFILGDTSYGSCCVDEVAAEHVSADAIVHFGHSCLSFVSRLPVFYVFNKFVIDTKAFGQEIRRKIPEYDKKIVIFYDVGYNHALDCIIKELAEYKNIKVTSLAKDFSLGKVGRVINEFGRGEHLQDYDSIYVGANDIVFFNLATSYPVKDWYLYDPQKSGDLEKVNACDSLWLRRRRFLVEKVKDAKRIGILIATISKIGYTEAVTLVNDLSKSRGKKTYEISVGKPNPNKLANFPEIDIFVLIGCPENALYDDTNREYLQPVVTVFELITALDPTWLNRIELAEDISSTVPPFSTQFSDFLKGGCYYTNGFAENDNEADMSLISGSIRNFDSSEVGKETVCDVINLRDDLHVAIGAALNMRSWNGLDPALGQTEVHLAAKGREGIPMGYQNEPK